MDTAMIKCTFLFSAIFLFLTAHSSEHRYHILTSEEIAKVRHFPSSTFAEQYFAYLKDGNAVLAEQFLQGTFDKLICCTLLLNNGVKRMIPAENFYIIKQIHTQKKEGNQKP